MERMINPIKDYFDENPKIRKILSIISIVAFLVIVIVAGIYSYTWKGFVDRTLLSFVDGLALSMLLFLMVSGFFLIFGLCDVINFAHGAFFMLGGFMGFTVYLGAEALLLDIGVFGTNYFAISIVAFIASAVGATAILALIGGGIEFFTIRRLYGNVIAQILLTVGFMFIITQVAEIIWGSPVVSYFIIPYSQIEYFFITGVFNLGGILVFQVYRVFLIFLGLGIAAVMFIAFKKTRIGLQIQAGIEDSEMVEALGTDIKKLLTIVFMIGAGLAGLSGAVLVPWIGANSGHGLTYLIFAFVIVVVGGAHYGRFEGTFFGALIVGFSMKFCAYFIPALESIIVFIIMAIILILKPGGLTGT
ncbi:branched-chain amino acid ABC transporter permease [Candidatus Thorarchaeota archaeon]|nr:MAG: branched-chain amino acid ABC transporter permease [Candidatus Thorarchaeota archaeon]